MKGIAHKAIAILLLALPLGAAAQMGYVTTTVNMRAGPDSSYPMVARLPSGSAVNVAGCIASYAWCDVYAGNLRGFVYSSYIVYPYQSNQVPIYSYGPALGLPLITFSIGNYWDNYYRGQPFYNNRSYWYARPYHPPPPRFHNDWRPPPYHGKNYYYGDKGHGNNYHGDNNNYHGGNNNYHGSSSNNHGGSNNYHGSNNDNHGGNNNYRGGNDNRPPDNHGDHGGRDRPPSQGYHGDSRQPPPRNADGGEAGG